MARLPRRILNEMSRYTAFQQAVWKACAAIPKGETRTYGWLARRVGRPGAARAVGMAMRTNPFAPLVPCHRVLRSDGGLGGYSARGGIARKAELLRKEKAKF